MTYDFPTGFSLWGPEELSAIDRVLSSGRMTMGPETEAFEAEFAAFHNKKYCVAVNSGSSANLLMIAVLMHKRFIKRGDFVAVPALAWSTTYAPLVQFGLQMFLADASLDTWCAPPDAYPMQARLFVGCSILGIPQDLPGLVKRVENSWFGEKAILIEDNCETFNGDIDGRLCGTFGLMSSFSFFYSHQLSAVEGGAILTDDYTLMKFLKQFRAHGWTRDIRYPRFFGEEYNFEIFGYNVRPVEMHCAVAREQLKKADAHRSARRMNRSYFFDRVDGLPIEWPGPDGEATANPFGLHFLCTDEETRQRLVTALRAAGVDCRLPTGGSFRLHQYGVPWKNFATPNADEIHRRGLFLGNAPYDISPLIDRAVTVMKATL